ncbi:MAG: restriction endonuclease subunit S [Spirosomataceae bacterium]
MELAELTTVPTTENQLPEGWILITKLENFGRVLNGLSGKTKEDFGEGEPYIPYVNVFKNDAIDIFELDYVKVSRGEKQNELKYGDIIFTTSSETVEEVGMTSVFLAKKGKYYLNSFCFIFRLSDFNWLLPEYARFVFRSETVRRDISLLGQGSTRYNLSKTRLLKELKFCLPQSLTEQRQIAAILTKIDEAIAQTEALIAKYNRLKTGIMQDLLSRGIDEQGRIRSEATHAFKDSPLGRIPVEWEVENLGSIFVLKSGLTPLRAISKYFSTEGYNWVKTLDLNEDNLVDTEEKVTDFALRSTSLKLMPTDSVLIAMYGGWEQIGRTAILKKEAGTNQAITCLFNPKRAIYAEYVQLFLQQNRWRWKQYAVSTRKDPNITKTDISNFLIAFPKLIDEQIQIAEKVIEVKENIHVLSQHLQKLQSLKAGLMQDLLSGRVRVGQTAEK